MVHPVGDVDAEDDVIRFHGNLPKLLDGCAHSNHEIYCPPNSAGLRVSR